MSDAPPEDTIRVAVPFPSHRDAEFVPGSRKEGGAPDGNVMSSGRSAVDNPPCNSSPVGLLWFDLQLLFMKLGYVPGIFRPLRASGPLDELFLSLGNVWALFQQGVSLVLQLLFILSLFLPQPTP